VCSVNNMSIVARAAAAPRNAAGLFNSVRSTIDSTEVARLDFVGGWLVCSFVVSLRCAAQCCRLTNVVHFVHSFPPTDTTTDDKPVTILPAVGAPVSGNSGRYTGRGFEFEDRNHGLLPIDDNR
jgi:hypothetical protein